MACVFAAGCIGSIGDGKDGATDPNEPEPEPGDFTCVPGDPSATVLQRLSRTQHLAALHAFLAGALGNAAEADVVLAALESTITLLPPDSSSDHARLDQAVSQAHVDGQYHLAEAAAAQLVANQARRDIVVGSCASDADPSNDEACLDQFIRRLGYLAHRRPLSDAEVAFYRDEVYPPANGMDTAAFRDVIAAMLLSPNALYRLEMAGEPVEGRDDLFELSAHELAVRLAFHFWDGAPDDALYAAADSGALLTEDGYTAEVDRLLAHPRTRETFDRYYAEWLLLDDLAPLDTQLGNPDCDAFVGDDIPTAELRDDVIQDTLDFTAYVSWQSDGDFVALFTSDANVAKTPDVAALYGEGTPVWQEGTEPTALPGRAGVLTRPAMLATGSVATHPTLRGREIRRRVLCDDLPPPPPDAMADQTELDPLMGARERMEVLTEDPSSSCISCHEWINPLGYPLEAFDGLGRLRTQEIIYGDDGEVLASLPLDLTVEANLEAGDDTVIEGGVELSHHIAQSNKARACFARHYFRFAFARVEDDQVDGCELENMRAALEEGRSIRDVFRDVAMSPTFRLRKLAD